MERELIVIRGAGDLATGSIHKLHRSGFNVLALESKRPSAIRRTVALSDAVYDGSAQVEDIKGVLINNPNQMEKVFLEDKVAIMIDPEAEVLKKIQSKILVDAIIAKKNLGTNLNLAQGVIAVGPGFEAGKDCHIVIETNRGHNLGRLIFTGQAQANTGLPGNIAGQSGLRVIYSPAEGKISLIRDIGDIVKKGEIIAMVDDISVTSKLDGVLRGIIRDGYYVTDGMKIADVDPRQDTDCYTISDKSRALGGAVLEAVLILLNKRNGNKER